MCNCVLWTNRLTFLSPVIFKYIGYFIIVKKVFTKYPVNISSFYFYGENGKESTAYYFILVVIWITKPNLLIITKRKNREVTLKMKVVIYSSHYFIFNWYINNSHTKCIASFAYFVACSLAVRLGAYTLTEHHWRLNIWERLMDSLLLSRQACDSVCPKIPQG